MLKMDPVALQYGNDSGRKSRDNLPVWKINALDQLVIDTFLALPATKRQMIRELVNAIAEGGNQKPL